MDEQMLIRQVMQGDDVSFQNLVQPHIKKARQSAYLLLRDYSLAEDAVQEALVQTYQSLHRYDPEKGPFHTWFYSIVINMSRKIYRKQVKMYLPFKEKLFRSFDHGPEHFMELREETRVIYQAIQQLDFKHKSVIVLFYFQEMNVKEVADILGIKEGTVKSRLHKARRKLSQLLKNQELEGGQTT